MKIAKTLLIALLLLTLAGPLMGCGVGTTTAENSRTIRRTIDLDARMLVDDLGTFAQCHRPFRGTRYVTD